MIFLCLMPNRGSVAEWLERHAQNREIPSSCPVACFSKVRKLFYKANSTKLGVSYVVKGKQLKKTAKFHARRRLCFEDTKRIVSPETRPISFRTFKKRVPALTTRFVPGSPWFNSLATLVHSQLVYLL